MRSRMPAAVVALGLVAVAGCGGSSSKDGPGGPQIGKARTFTLKGLPPEGPVRPGRPTTLELQIEQPEGGPLTRYKTGSGPHTGVHVIMVREDLSQLVHRHPRVGEDGTLRQEVAFPSAGPWRVVADAYPDLGANTIQNFQLTGDVEVQGAYRPRPIGPIGGEAEAGGLRFSMRKTPRLRALRPQYVDIDVRTSDGRTPDFSTYYGALAHAIFFREGSLTYFHTHVCGPGMPDCAASAGGESVAGRSSKPGRLRVGMLLPSPGTWRLFLQARADGKVVTVPYTLRVQ